MAKKLTLSDIKKSNSKYDEKKRIELDEEVFVDIYPNFKPTKIKELIQEMVTDTSRAKEVGIDFDSINPSDWGLFNIIAKFADLGVPTDIKKKVQAFNEINEYEYFDKIINAFPEESVDKVTKALENFTETLVALNNNQIESNGVIQ
ncbi:hypothetical protein [Psychrobacillus phage Perkons]|nr:hypothetical protein [Psychrobacillus phage Perkons]